MSRPEPASHAETRDSRTARGVAAVAGVLAVAAALAIAARATDSGERAAHPGRARGWFRGAPALAAPMSGPVDGRTPGRGEQDMRSLVTAGAALAIGAAAQAQSGEPVQWRIEDGGNGHWYAVVSSGLDAGAGSSWDVLDSTSRQQGGRLCTIGDSGENSFVSNLVTAFRPVNGLWAYMGATQVSNNPCGRDSWVWNDGTSWTFTNWQPQQPDCLIGSCSSCDEPKIGMRSFSGQWGDWNGRDLTSAIIEWSADCDSNGIVDFGEIRAGQLPDENANNVPDDCECAAYPELDACCPGDLYRNGVVNGADLGILLAEWGAITPTTTSDLHRDGTVDGGDLGILLSGWGPCPG